MEEGSKVLKSLNSQSGARGNRNGKGKSLAFFASLLDYPAFYKSISIAAIRLEGSAQFFATMS